MSTPSIEDVLAAHQGYASERYDERGTYYVMCCDCDWEEPKQPDSYAGSSSERFHAHLADAIRAHLAEHADEAAGAVERVRQVTEEYAEYAFHPSIPTGKWAVLRADAVVETYRAALAGGASGVEGAES